MYLGPNTVSRRPFAKTTNWGYSTGYRAVVLGSASTAYSTNISGAVTLSFNYDPSGNSNGSFSGNGKEIIFRNGSQFVTPNAANNAWNLRNLVLENGNVGIGVNPSHSLDILNTASGDAAIQIKSTTGGDPTLIFNSAAANRQGIIKFQDNGTNVGRIDYVHSADRIDIQAGSATGATMSIENGDVSITGDVTQNSVTVKQEYFTLPASSTSGRRIRITLSNYESCYVRIGAQRTNGGDAICYWEGIINNNNNANYATVFQSKSGNPAITFDYTTTTIFQWTFNASLSSGWGTFYVQEIGGTATIQQLMT